MSAENPTVTQTPLSLIAQHKKMTAAVATCAALGAGIAVWGGEDQRQYRVNEAAAAQHANEVCLGVVRSRQVEPQDHVTVRVEELTRSEREGCGVNVNLNENPTAYPRFDTATATLRSEQQLEITLNANRQQASEAATPGSIAGNVLLGLGAGAMICLAMGGLVANASKVGDGELDHTPYPGQQRS